jgi:hypothetical protein
MFAHVRSYEHWQRWFANASEASLRSVADVLERETAVDDWVLVDRGIVAFLANRRGPPFLTMLSVKRVQTVLTNNDLTNALDHYHPAMLVLCSRRLSGFDQFRAHIESRLYSHATGADNGWRHANKLPFFRRSTR